MVGFCCCVQAFSSCGEWGLLLRGIGFSLQRLLLLQTMGSRVQGLSSCSAQAYLLRGMWDLPAPGIEPMSLALPGRFLTTAPTAQF